MKTITTAGALEHSDRLGWLSALKPDSSPPTEHTQKDGEACVPNISSRERLKRLIGGVIPFVSALAILAWLISTGANRLWRLPLFVLFVASASGFFQWRDKT
jgi:hypothetical protein